MVEYGLQCLLRASCVVSTFSWAELFKYCLSSSSWMYAHSEVKFQNIGCRTALAGIIVQHVLLHICVMLPLQVDLFVWWSVVNGCAHCWSR